MLLPCLWGNRWATTCRRSVSTLVVHTLAVCERAPTLYPEEFRELVILFCRLIELARCHNASREIIMHISKGAASRGWECHQLWAASQLKAWIIYGSVDRPFLFVAKSNSPIMCSPLSFDHDRGLIGVIVSVLNVLRMNWTSYESAGTTISSAWLERRVKFVFLQIHQLLVTAQSAYSPPGSHWRFYMLSVSREVIQWEPWGG